MRHLRQFVRHTLPVVAAMSLVACAGSGPQPVSTATPVATPSPTVTLTPTVTPTPKPPLGRCRGDQDCRQAGGDCFAPDVPPCPTAPTLGPTPACTQDGDCAPLTGFVCGRPNLSDCPCCFQLQHLVCIPGCVSDSQCGGGQVCTATHHCEARPCLADQDCPQYFYCGLDRDTGALSCNRRFCSSDVDCAGGFCVDSKCYGEFGRCFVPVP
jgi:hypothetical protein